MKNNTPYQALWLQFEKKIIDDWHTKYNNFGVGLYDISHKKTTFYKVIQADIIKKTGDPDSISAATIGRFIESKKISEDTKKSTLDIISKYLEYKNWLDFRAQNADLMDDTAVLPNDFVELLEELTVSPVKKLNKKWLYASIILLVLGAPYCVWLAFGGAMPTKDFSEQEKIFFDKLVRQANQRSYNLMMQNSPIIDSAVQWAAINKGLDEFYTQKGTAKSGILGDIAQATRHKRAYCIPPSSFEVIYVKCLEKTDKYVVLETKEHWYLLIKKSATNFEEKIYDNLNVQTYYLKKENDVWKIDINKYEGTARRVSK